MRFLIALLLVAGGSIAAFALSWFFFSMQNEQLAFETETVTPDTVQEQAIAEQNPLPADNATLASAGSAASTNQPPLTEEELLRGLPNITLARIGADGSAVLAGLAAPASQIIVKENDVQLASGQADDNGEWVIILETNLSPGNHLLTIEMRTQSGIVKRDQRAVLVEIAKAEQDTPLVALVPVEEQKEGVAADQQADKAEVEILSVPKSLSQNTGAAETASGTSPQQPPVVSEIRPVTADKQVQQPVEVAQIPAAIFINTLAWQSSTALRINGNAQSGERVTVRFAGLTSIADYNADTGRWSATLTLPQSLTGIVSMQAELMSDADDSIASTQIDVDVSQLEIGRDGREMVVIKKGDMLWRIAYRTYGQGIRYLDIVKQNQSRISNPDIIFPTQIFILPSEQAQ